jgi:3-hydroxyisobutyrate dehydrogenase
MNFWLAVLVEGMVETLTLGEALGLDPRLFLAAIADGPLASEYALTKGAAMQRPVHPGLPAATRDEGRRTRLERRPSARGRAATD